MRLAMIDTETTGLLPDGEVVSIAVVHFSLGTDDHPTVALHRLVRPVGPMGATEIHGITAEDVADAPTWAEVLPSVLEAIGDRWKVAHNAPFDARMTGIEGPWLCSQVPAMIADKYQSGKRLVDIARRRGIELAAHSAAADAVAAAVLYREVLRELRPSVRTLEALTAWTRREGLAVETEGNLWRVKAGLVGELRWDWHDWTGTARPAVRAPEYPAVRMRIDAAGVIHD